MFVFNKWGHSRHAARRQTQSLLCILCILWCIPRVHCPLVCSVYSVKHSVISIQHNSLTISTTYFLWPGLTAGISTRLLIFCLRNHYQGYSERTKIKAWCISYSGLSGHLVISDITVISYHLDSWSIISVTARSNDFGYLLRRYGSGFV